MTETRWGGKPCRRFLGADNMTDECVACGYPENEHYIDVEFYETPLSRGETRTENMTQGNGASNPGDDLTIAEALEAIVGALAEANERMSNIEVTLESINERLNNLSLDGD